MFTPFYVGPDCSIFMRECMYVSMCAIMLKKTSVLSLPFTSNTSQITYGHFSSVRMASWFALNIGFAVLKFLGLLVNVC